jgi:hypothetical protein
MIFDTGTCALFIIDITVAGSYLLLEVCWVLIPELCSFAVEW